MRLAGLTLQLPTLKSVNLVLVCPLAVRFILISLFFACSPFVDVSLNRQISAAFAADREANGRIFLPVQAVLEEPLQPSKLVKLMM